MTENILELVKKEVAGVISSNINIPANKRDETIEATTTGFLDGLKKQATNGVLSSVFGSSNGSSTDFLSQSFLSPIISLIESKLVDSVGLNKDLAKSISTMVVPATMKLLSSKSNKNGGSLDMKSLISELLSANSKGGGGLLSGLGSLLGK